MKEFDFSIKAYNERMEDIPLINTKESLENIAKMFDHNVDTNMRNPNLYRDIIFRGLTIPNSPFKKSEWVYGHLLKVPGAAIYYIFNTQGAEFSGSWSQYEVYPESIGQLTPFKDMNDLSVFEGDILRGKVTVNGDNQIRKGRSYATYKEIEITCNVEWDHALTGFRLVCDQKNEYMTDAYKGIGATKMEKEANAWRRSTKKIEPSIKRVPEFEKIGTIHE